MELLGNRDNSYLFRAQPGREHACVFLDKPCKSSLIASHGCTMNNIRTFFGTVFVNVIHIKLFSQKSIPLNRDHGIFLAVYVFGIDIYLRSVEGSFSHVLYKRNIQFLKHVADMAFCLFPDFRFTDVFLSVIRIPFGQVIGNILFHTQNLQTILCKRNTVFEFFYHLIRSDDQVAFGNRELADTGQTMHFTGILITEQSGSFTVAQRQIAVTVLFCFVYIILERTGHRTKRIDFFIFFLISKDKHTILVVIPVSGNLVQITLGHQRCFGSDVSAFCFLILDPALKLLHHNHTVRHNQRKTLANNIYGCEKLHFTSKLVVVALLGFFHLIQMFFQFILGCIGSSVNTGQHLILFTSSPVCTGRRKKFERFDTLGAHQMRACTKICPVSLRIEGNLCIFRKIFDQFHFIWFIFLLEECDCLFSGPGITLDFCTFFDDFFHLFFDFIQILAGEWRTLEIIIKSGVNGWSNRNFCVWI